MTTILDEVQGRIFVPEFGRAVFLPGRTTARKPGHQALFRFAVRSGDTGRVTQAGFGLGLIPTDGLIRRWEEIEAVNRAYATPEDFIASFGDRLRQAADPAYRRYLWTHNERTDNGANMAMKLLYNVSSPDHAASFPTRMALCNLVSFAAAHGDLSIGSATHDVTTNEYTTAGLSRTGALTPAPTTPSALDGQYQIVIANTFTCTSGPQTVYGAALFDAAVGTSNMYCEATSTSATLQTNDTFQGTWTNKG